MKIFSSQIASIGDGNTKVLHYAKLSRKIIITAFNMGTAHKALCVLNVFRQEEIG